MDTLFDFQKLFAENQILFFIIIAWTLYWKGVALWKSARLGSQGWFIALLIINTIGILEILYIYVFSKKKEMGGGKVSE